MVANPYDFSSIRVNNEVKDAVARYTKDVSRDPIEGWISGNDAQSATRSLGNASEYNAEWIDVASKYWGRFTNDVWIGNTFSVLDGTFRGFKISHGLSAPSGTSPVGLYVTDHIATIAPILNGSTSAARNGYITYAKSAGTYKWIINPEIETGLLTASTMFVKGVSYNPLSVPNVDYVNQMISNQINGIYPTTFTFTGTFTVSYSPGKHPNNWSSGTVSIPPKGWEWINYWVNVKGRKTSQIVSINTRSNGVGWLVSAHPAPGVGGIQLNFVQFQAANAHTGVATIQLVVLDA